MHDTPVVDVAASVTSADAQLLSIQALRLESEQDLWHETPFVDVGAVLRYEDDSWSCFDT